MLSTMWEKGSEDAIEGLVDLIHPYFVFGTTVFDHFPYEKLGFFYIALNAVTNTGVTKKLYVHKLH